jgi:hypothetical protein
MRNPVVELYIELPKRSSICVSPLNRFGRVGLMRNSNLNMPQNRFKGVKVKTVGLAKGAQIKQRHFWSNSLTRLLMEKRVKTSL